MKYADLHVHTFYSDSTFSPEEVVSCAVEKKIDAVAICDHDSIDGIEPCRRIGAELGVEIIPAIELTAEKVDIEVHMLGYFVDWKIPWFQEKLREIQKLRIGRVYKMVDKLKGENVEIDPDDVFKLAGKGSVGRLHMAQAMLKAGKIKRLQEAFDKYIGFLKPCYVPNIRFSPQNAIELILSVGGVPVLAHPYTIRKDECIPEFVEYGLRGIEVYHTDHKPIIVQHYEETAKRYGLIATGGSDCHGLGKGKVLMGGVRVPYSVVEKLKEESERIRRGV
ncbi:MAG: PHP domain-containing protein [Candidatus Omnitrophota bacterium]